MKARMVLDETRDGNGAIPRRGLVKHPRPREKKTSLFPVPIPALGCYSPLFPAPVGLSGPHGDPDTKIGFPTSPIQTHIETTESVFQLI